MINIKDSEFRELTSYIKKRYGLNLTEKKQLIEGRLSNMIIEQGFKDFSSYLKFVFADTSGKEINSLINKLTTNYTYFYQNTLPLTLLVYMALLHLSNLHTIFLDP